MDNITKLTALVDAYEKLFRLNNSNYNLSYAIDEVAQTIKLEESVRRQKIIDGKTTAAE